MEVIQLENQLMKSNCYIVVDWNSMSCVIIDPASLDSEREIAYIEEHSLTLDYVIITHGHADHCWGVNTLREAYPSLKLVYSEACNQTMNKAIRLFFQLYSEDPNYKYEMKPAEIQIKENGVMDWHGHSLRFILTPGHSLGSMCIEIEGKLFTGDTIMPYPPYFNGRGSNKEDWAKSVKMMENTYSPETLIYPGHGESLTMCEWTTHQEWIMP